MDDRIIIDPAICNGRPVVRGTRITAQTVLVIVFASFGFLVQSAEQNPALGRKHSWQRIEYHPIPSRQPGIGDFWLGVGSGGYDNRTVLRFGISFGGPVDGPLPKPIENPTSFIVRLRTSDGRVAVPCDGYLPRRSYGVMGNSLGATYSVSYELPWMGVVREESWIELGLPGQKYLISLPGGFLMNTAEIVPSERNENRVVAPRVVRAPGKDETYVNWKRVCYELGRIQSGWHLSLYISNSRETNAEVVLYREYARWSVDAPKVMLQIKPGQEEVILGRHTGTRLHEDGMRRSDDFQVSVSSKLGQEWGVIGIKVDNIVYEQLVPLSLFNNSRGTDNLENGALSVQPTERP